MNFLPTDYQLPKTNSAYLKLQDGENRIRILTSPILGWEDWENKKPIRFRMTAKPDKSVDASKPIKHFWAFVIWSYQNQKIMILQITQSSILKKITSLSNDKDWGSPYNYDLKIIKKGQSVDTEYDVNPISPRELEMPIKEAFVAAGVDLEELFAGGDPFAPSGYRTQGYWEKTTTPLPSAKETESEYISPEQAKTIEKEIHLWISKEDPNWRAAALQALKIDNFSLLPKKHLDILNKRLQQKKDSLVEEILPF